MLIEKLAKWQMLLSEFGIVYVTQKAIKAQVLADHLAEKPVDEEYEPLNTFFHDKEISFVGADISEAYLGWRLFFDGAANHQGKGIKAVITILWQLNSDLIAQTIWLNMKPVFLD